MTKRIRIIVCSLGICCVLLFSLKFEKPDEYKATHSANSFDAPSYALRVWNEVLPQKKKDAAEILEILDLLDKNPSMAFTKYSRVLGISKTHYFLLKGEGIIETIGEESITVKIENHRRVEIATDFIFGNSIRDGSGGVMISEFVNMSDFNEVSIAINNIVKEKVIPGLKIMASPGTRIKYVGTTEISENNLDLESILIIPLEVTMIATGNE